MKKLTLMLAVALAMVLPSHLSAQTSQAASATVTVSDILELSVTNTAISFGTVTSSGYAAGDVSSTVTHEANVTHTVQVKADGGWFTSSSALNDSTIAASRVEWSKDAGATWSQLSTTAANVVLSAPAGSASETVQYQMNILATDPKDTYTLSFTYSIISG